MFSVILHELVIHSAENTVCASILLWLLWNRSHFVLKFPLYWNLLDKQLTCLYIWGYSFLSVCYEK